MQNFEALRPCPVYAYKWKHHDKNGLGTYLAWKIRFLQAKRATKNEKITWKNGVATGKNKFLMVR